MFKGEGGASSSTSGPQPLSAEEPVDSPPLKDFELLLAGVRKSGHTLVDGIGGLKKQRRMQWCLAEAFRHATRSFFRGTEPVMASLIQDSTQEPLALNRFFVCPFL